MQYDIFISHAFEDKASFADELAKALKKKRLKLWYSGLELEIGKSIAGSVNEALACSAYGVVILSPTYIRKQWAMSELKALLTQETVQDRVLPVLHDITIDEVRQHVPLLADRYAISTEKGIQVVVNRILEVVKGKRRYTRKQLAASPPISTPAKPEKERKKSSPPALLSKTGIMISGSVTISGQVAGRDIINHSKKQDHGNINSAE